MRIGVIDDEKYSRDELIHQILQVIPDAHIHQAASGAQGIKLLDSYTFDVLFIDIHLGDMEGTLLAPLAQKLNPKTRVVFATAYSEYAVKAFELLVDNYILKPFDPDRVRQVLELCLPQPMQHSSPPRHNLPTVRRLAISVNRHTVFVNLDDLMYIETDGAGRGCILHTTKEDFTDNTALTEYELRLAPHGFYRIHKTCLVHLKYVQDIFPWQNSAFGLRLQHSGTILPIGRNRLKGLRQQMDL
jgi:DNA-binding LytR/AlgR family response regulator